MLPANINKQLKSMVRDGVPIKDAAESLGVSLDAASLAMMGEDKQKVNVTDLIEGFRSEAIEILMDVARHGQKDADRVKACQILVEGKGIMPEVNAAAADKLLGMFEDMKRRTSGIIIDVTNGNEVMAFGK